MCRCNSPYGTIFVWRFFSGECNYEPIYTLSSFYAAFIFNTKCTWVDMMHGNGLCLWTLSKHRCIVCHMLHQAQVAHQKDFRLEIIHPLCSYWISAFTLSPLSFKRSLLIGVFFLSGWLPNSLSIFHVLLFECLQDVLLFQLCTHNTTFNSAIHWYFFY